MFGFGKSSKDPLAHKKDVERWLASLAANDPMGAQAAILVELSAAAKLGAARTPVRLEALFHLDALSAELRSSLTVQYLEQGDRSTRVGSQLWQALFDLNQEFLLCYEAFARDAAVHVQNSKWQALLPELVARQIMHEGLDAKIRLYRYEQWIPSRWLDLHALFQQACSAQVERVPIGPGADGALRSIEQEYVRVLLLQLMNTGNLAPKHVEWVASQLPDWCAPLHLSLEPHAPSSFYVDLGEGTGLRRRAPQPLEGRVLFLDTRPLHAVLMQNVVMLEQKVRSHPLSDRAPQRTERLNLLRGLATRVDPEFRPVARRGQRSRASGLVEAIVGFPRIAAFLKGDLEEALVEPKPHAGNLGEAVQIATLGRARGIDPQPQDATTNRPVTHAGGAWEVRDVSQTGYRLVAPMPQVDAVTLGTLVAMREQDQGRWSLGIVRRMKRLSSERAEIGLQVIADNLVAVDLSSSQGDGPDRLSDGEVSPITSRSFDGLLLSLTQRGTNAPIQTMITPGADYQPGRRLHMSMAQTRRRIAFGRLLERHAEWVWATVEPLDEPRRAVSDAGR